MNTHDEVMKIGRKLDKIIAEDGADQTSAVDLLKVLQDLPVTLTVLQKTKIGMTVNNLRKVCKDEEAVSLSKAVIKSWKKLVPETGGSNSGSTHGGSGRSGGSHKESSHKDGSHKDSSHKSSSHHSDQHSSKSSSSKSGGNGDQPNRRCGSGSTSARSTSAASISSTKSDESPKHALERSESDSLNRSESIPLDRGESISLERSDSLLSDDSNIPQSTEAMDTVASCSSPDKQSADSFIEDTGLQLSPTTVLPNVEVDETSDPTRLKCRELLATALRAPPSVVEDGRDCDTIAAEIEHFVFKQFDNSDMKYKNRIRSRIANLKDTKNPQLKEHVLNGKISTKYFSMMSPEEMASDELRKLREKLAKEAFNDHQMSTSSGTKSDLFKCGRCGKRNTTYNQLQTRSSDEPMTTFVFCNECGNRWKFC